MHEVEMSQDSSASNKNTYAHLDKMKKYQLQVF